MNITRTIWNFTKSCMVKIVTVRKFRSVCSSIFAGLAGEEGPRVSLMLGDAPSLLEHLKSNLENNQLGKHSLTVRPRVTAYYRDRFVRSLFLPYPPSSRSFIVIVDPSFYLVFPLSFFFLRFLYLLRLAPTDEAVGMVPFPSKFQRDSSSYTLGDINKNKQMLRSICYLALAFALK
jgi:hypothetical protein